MNPFANTAISASAGTGKTWALAHRYLALLSAGVAPDRICALTFSRKAAGEIFDTIVRRLCAAAGDERERALVAACVAAESPDGAPSLASRGLVVRLLRALLDQSHRLRIGTLDSFILGVVRSFPLELGLPPEAQPMNNDGGEAAALRRELLTRLCDPRLRDPAEPAAYEALLDAFRQASFGSETKSLTARLEQIVLHGHGFYRRHAGKAWGAAGTIWRSDRWWEGADEAQRRRALEPDYLDELRQAFGGGRNDAQLGDTLAAAAVAAAGHTPDQPWPFSPSRVISDLFRQAPFPEPPAIEYYRKSCALPPPLWPPLRAALCNLVAAEVRRSLMRTAGLYALLARYDTASTEAQRRDGRLTFEDLSCLLADPALRPSRSRGATDRLYIDYRLDGQLDHWLLDEFQDTSDGQWNAIANLIDEVVQDAEGRRSFFYVGDVKQSIYGWRGGNHRLFAQVRERCGIGEVRALVDCHRSRPAPIEAVNRVFGALGAWTPAAGAGKGPHRGAVDAFLAAWREHRSAQPARGKGFAALLEYAARAGPDTRTEPSGDEAEAGGADGEESDPAAYDAVVRVLELVDPVRRGLSAAVLVRGNAAGRDCADVLRRRLRDVPVVHEGTGGIVDSPVVTLLLALVRCAAHPADTAAARHVQMSPLAGDAALAGLPARFLGEVHEAGFAGALRAWSGRLETCGALRPDDPFGRQRLRELLAAAEAFDATGSCDADAFDDHIRAHQVKCEAAAGAVRVMTVHQSKGLGFDVVLVPFDPRARSFSNTQEVRMLSGEAEGDGGRDIGWVLQPPCREALRAAGGPPVGALESARAELNFAQLCVLYVAMTRAKQALFMLVPERPKASSSVRETDLLRDTLAGDGPSGARFAGLPVLYASGDPAWFERPAGRPAPLPAPAAVRPAQVTFEIEAIRREPSKDRAEDRPFPAPWLFGEDAGGVRAFGSAIHRLFERIEWIEDADIEGVVAAWREEAMESAAVRRDVEAQFRNCAASPEVRAVLARPAGAARCEVWRETPFDWVRETGDGPEIVTGRFDRVVVERDASGRPLRATVVDFKSNRVADERQMAETAEGYRGQMRDYAAAAARLLGLPAAAVKAKLLFTRLGRVAELHGWEHLPETRRSTAPK